MSDTIVFGGNIVSDERGAVVYTLLKYLIASREIPRLNEIFTDEEFERSNRYGWWDLSDLSVDDWLVVSRLIDRLENECPAAIPDWREEARPFFVSRLTPLRSDIAKRVEHIRAGEPRTPIKVPAGPIRLTEGEYPPLETWLKLPPARALDAAPILNAVVPFVGRPTLWPNELLRPLLQLQYCDHISGRWEAELLVTPYGRYSHRDASVEWASANVESESWSNSDSLAVSNGLFRLGLAVISAPGDLLQQHAKLDARQSIWYRAMTIRMLLAARGFAEVESIDWKMAQVQMFEFTLEKQGQADDLLRANGLRRPRRR